jgi:hypothetical protein
MALDQRRDLGRSLLGQVVPGALDDRRLDVGPAVFGAQERRQGAMPGPKTCSPPTSSSGTSTGVWWALLKTALSGMVRHISKAACRRAMSP